MKGSHLKVLGFALLTDIYYMDNNLEVSYVHTSSGQPLSSNPHSCPKDKLLEVINRPLLLTIQLFTASHLPHGDRILGGTPVTNGLREWRWNSLEAFKPSKTCDL